MYLIMPEWDDGEQMFLVRHLQTSESGGRDPGWEVQVVLPGTSVATLTGLQPSCSYTIRWGTV